MNFFKIKDDNYKDLVKNELITFKEAKKMNLYSYLYRCATSINPEENLKVEIVDVNKYKTYWFFGARFQSKIESNEI